MHTGHVKSWNSEEGFGYVVTSDGREYHVASAVVTGDMKPGDLVEVEVGESDGRPSITSLKVTKPAPPDNPVGRTMAPPPTWEQLEEVDRERRAAKRRRR